ncbi:MAG TPA: PAS domain S-box protein [Prosthecobacter sp.]
MSKQTATFGKSPHSQSLTTVLAGMSSLPRTASRLEAAGGLATCIVSCNQLTTTQQAMLDALPVHVALISEEGVILAVNEAWRRFAVENDYRGGGCGVGLNYLDVCAASEETGADGALSLKDSILQVLRGEIPQYETEYSCHGPARQAWFRMAVTPTGDAIPTGAVISHHNITERKQAELALQESEREQRELVRELREERARLVSAQRVGKVGSWEIDVASQAMIWSAETHRIFETDSASFQPTHEKILACIHPEDRAAASQTFLCPLPCRVPCTVEHRLLMPDGRIKHAEERWQTFFDENGCAVRTIGTCQDITERSEASQEIERNVALLRAVADGTPDAIFVKNLEGRYQFFNEGAARLAGLPVEEVLGRDDTTIFPPEDARQVMENDRQTMACGRAVTREEVLTSGGVRRTYLATKAPYHDRLGNAIGLIGISRDITALKEQEHRLAVLSTLGRNLNTATTARRAAEIIVAAADEMIGWDAATLDLYSAEEDRITALLNIDTIDGRRTECPPAYDGEPPSSLAREIITTGARLLLRSEASASVPPGRMFGDKARPSASLMFVPIRDNERVAGVLSIQSYRANAYNGEALRVLELLADHCRGVLSRIQTESLRKVSEERFREMAENIGDVFFTYAPAENRLLYANQAFERLWGLPLHALHEDPRICLQHVHPDDLAEVEATALRQLAGEQTEVEFRIIRPDKSMAWVRKIVVPIFDENHRVTRLVGTMRDVTERRTTADRLAEQAALLDKAQDAIMVRDLNDHILFWNKSAERLYGWTEEEALGQPLSQLLYKDPTPLLAATAAILKSGEWTGEIEKRTKTGKPITIECHWSLVRDEKGHPKAILMIDTDVTERRLIEQQYLRAQRMESIGTLAGGIAHDLNNVLAPILMSIDLLRLQEKNTTRLNVLGTIEQSAKRGADMVRQVLSFARGVEGRQMEVEVGPLVRELDKIANETFLKNIRVKTSVPDGLWIVEGDPTQLHQVLLNLCVNARDAMPDGGTLTLSASNLMLDGQYACMNMGARPGPHVCICVEDTGSGMSPEVMDRIFEPFFTTKDLGKGTGLGLSTTQAIVKSHGGFVRVCSEAGKGTRFEVHLPARPEAALHGAAETQELPRGNGQLVLVVDDEESIRQITCQTLEAFGYRTLMAGDGGEAVAIYARHQEEIDIVLTDMMMPVMDGPATIHVLKRINPTALIIAASGLNANNMAARATQAGVKDFLHKPYTTETLLTALQKALC